MHAVPGLDGTHLGATERASSALSDFLQLLGKAIGSVPCDLSLKHLRTIIRKLRDLNGGVFH